jgi:hypothetical protein
MMLKGFRPGFRGDPHAAFAKLHKARTRDEALSKRQLTELGIGYHGALSSLTGGRGSDADLYTLACASNVALTLCEIGYGADEIEDVKRAQDLLIALIHDDRCVLRGPEIKQLQSLLALHDAQLEAVTEGEWLQCKDEVERRIRTGLVLEVAA